MNIKKKYKKKLNIQKILKKKKKDPKIEPMITEVNKEKIKILDASPNNIYMKEGYPLDFKQLASIFQIIKEKIFRC